MDLAVAGSNPVDHPTSPGFRHRERKRAERPVSWDTPPDPPDTPSGYSPFLGQTGMAGCGTIMKASTRNRAKGIAKQVKGRIKETAGQATRSARLEQEGRAEAKRGRAREKLGEAEQQIEKLTGEE